MSWFNFGWFKSAERKRLEEEIASLQQQLVKATEVEAPREMSIINLKPYKTVYFNNGIVTAVLRDGEVLSKQADKAFLNNVLKARNVDELLAMFTIIQPKVQENTMGYAATPEEKKIIDDNSFILRKTNDFEFKGGDIFLNGCNLAIPEIVLASFIEFTERGMTDEYEALKMFWLWTSLNPIEASRNDVLKFVRHNNIAITRNGLMKTYRKIVVKKDEKRADKKQVEFISEQYLKVKKWKKGTKNYEIWQSSDDVFVLNDVNRGDAMKGICLGILEDLYKDLSKKQENTYTDNYTKKKVIKLGAIYREDEDKIDLDNSVECSNGLHVGGKDFGFSSFGDTGVLALVNPMKVRAVPQYDSQKMRVSEMFIAGIYSLDEFKKDEEGMEDFSEEYCNSTIQELLGAVKGKDFAPLSCKDNKPALSLLDVSKVLSELQNRVKTI